MRAHPVRDIFWRKEKLCAIYFTFARGSVYNIHRLLTRFRIGKNSSPPIDRKAGRIILRKMEKKQKDVLLIQLGARLRALRLAAGFTVKRFAEQADLSPRFINQIEAGTGNISVSGLARISAALRCTMAELLPPPASDQSLRAEVWRLLDGYEDSDWQALQQWLLKRKGQKTTPRFIAIIGILGAGKSTLGPLLAAELKTEFVELDAKIEEAAGMPLADLFATHGESYYRRLEHEVLTQLFATSRGCVFAPGGSVVTDAESWQLVKQRCYTIWLHAAPEELMKRTKRKGNPRLMSRPSVLTDMKNLLTRREPLYAESQLTIRTTGKTPSRVLREVLDALPS